MSYRGIVSNHELFRLEFVTTARICVKPQWMPHEDLNCGKVVPYRRAYQRNVKLAIFAEYSKATLDYVRTVVQVPRLSEGTFSRYCSCWYLGRNPPENSSLCIQHIDDEIILGGGISYFFRSIPNWRSSSIRCALDFKSHVVVSCIDFVGPKWSRIK